MQMKNCFQTVIHLQLKNLGKIKAIKGKSKPGDIINTLNQACAEAKSQGRHVVRSDDISTVVQAQREFIRIDISSREPISFSNYVSFNDNLSITTYNNEQDLIVGQISKLEQPNAIYLGKIAEEDYMSKDLWLDLRICSCRVYVMGSRRSGKSYTLGTIAEGLSLNNLSTGNVQNGVLILDTLNLYWTSESESTGE